jgi:hypothetical protein
MHVRDERVTSLLTAAVNARVDWLAEERPSRALSLLQFTRVFGDATAPRAVVLPDLIGSDIDGNLVLYRPPIAGSFADAEASMRAGLGIGLGSRVPLAAD